MECLRGVGHIFSISFVRAPVFMSDIRILKIISGRWCSLSGSLRSLRVRMNIIKSNSLQNSQNIRQNYYQHLTDLFSLKTTEFVFIFLHRGGAMALWLG